jgi:hypothetical protein
MAPNLRQLKPPLRQKKAEKFFWWVALGSWYFIITGLHIKMTLLITSPFAFPGGSTTISHHTGRLMAGLAAALGIWLAARAASGKISQRLAAAWTCWAAATAAICFLLVCTFNELAHIPQYAILAVLLARCMDPGAQGRQLIRMLFWTAVLGLGDELNQYFFLRSPYSIYFDWNDTVLNMLGAAAGLLLRYGDVCQAASAGQRSGFLSGSSDSTGRPEMLFAVAGTACAAALWLAGMLHFTTTQTIPPGGLLRQAGRNALFLERKPGIAGSWQPRSAGGRYYVLSTGAALIALPLLLAGLSLVITNAGRAVKAPSDDCGTAV